MHVLRTCSLQSRKTYSGNNVLAKNLAEYRLSSHNKHSDSMFKSMHSFALVFEIDNELGNVVVQYLRDAACTIANALEFEETRVRYVVAESSIMTQLQDKLWVDHEARVGSSRMHPHKDLAKSEKALVLNDQMALDLIFQSSSLARLLKYLFHSINEGVGVTAAVVNNCTRFALNRIPVEPPPKSQSSNLFFAEHYQHQPVVHSPSELINSIRRYHTMVLRMDLQATQIDDLVGHLLHLHQQPHTDGTHGANSPETKHLNTFITGLNPLKSFDQLHVEMGIQLRQCFEIAAHLVYWKVGMVIKTLSRANRYRVASRTRPEDSAYTAKAFTLRFAPFDIKRFLIRVGTGASLGDIIDDLKDKDDGHDTVDTEDASETSLTANGPSKLPAKKLTEERLLQILVFLLGAKKIEEINTYIYLKVPHDAHSPRRSNSLPSTPTNHDKSVPEPDGRHLSVRGPPLTRTTSDPQTETFSNQPQKLHSRSLSLSSSLPRPLRSGKSHKMHARSASSLSLRSLNKDSSGAPLYRTSSRKHVDMRFSPLHPKRSTSEGILTTFVDMNPNTSPSQSSVGLGGVASWLDEQSKRYLNKMEKSYLAKHFTVKRLQKNAEGIRAREMQKMFLRLLPYFRGTHHIEEIIWVESLHEKSAKVSRADIELLLKVFKSVLITVEHESPVS